MKRTSLEITMFSFMLAVCGLAIPASVGAEEISPMGGSPAVVPGQMGTMGTVPTANMGSGLPPASATSGIVPSVQAPAPSFGAEPVGGTGLSAPANGAILPQTPNGAGNYVGSQLPPNPPALGTAK